MKIHSEHHWCIHFYRDKEFKLDLLIQQQLNEMVFALKYKTGTSKICERLVQMPDSCLREYIVDEPCLDEDYEERLKRVKSIVGLYTGPYLRPTLQQQGPPWMQQFLPKLPAGGFIKNYLNISIWGINLTEWLDIQNFCIANVCIRYVTRYLLAPALHNGVNLLVNWIIAIVIWLPDLDILIIILIDRFGRIVATIFV